MKRAVKITKFPQNCIKYAWVLGFWSSTVVFAQKKQCFPHWHPFQTRIPPTFALPLAQKLLGSARKCSEVARKCSEVLGSCSEVLGSARKCSGSCSEVLGSCSEVARKCSEVLGSCSEVARQACEHWHVCVNFSKILAQSPKNRKNPFFGRNPPPKKNPGIITAFWDVHGTAAPCSHKRQSAKETHGEPEVTRQREQTMIRDQCIVIAYSYFGALKSKDLCVLPNFNFINFVKMSRSEALKNEQPSKSSSSRLH